METANLPPLGGLGLKTGGHVEKRKTYGAASGATTSYTVGVGGQGLFATKVKKEELDDDSLTTLSTIDKDFEQFSTLNIELTADHVPLGEILERLQSDDGDNRNNNFIRLHAVTTDSAAPSTISATLNVATLDLSAAGSFQHTFGELNDMLFGISKSTAALSSATDPSTSPTTSSSSMLSSPSFSPSLTVPESSATFLSNNNNNNNIFSPGERSSNKNNGTAQLLATSPASSGSSSSVTSPPSAVVTAAISSHGFDPSKSSPQECSLCNKMFGNASALAKHRLTHSDERKYLCTVCHKAFKRQDHLNGHLLTHRNKKPFECTTEGCNKSYCDARSLRRHRENHHHHSAAAGSREGDKQLVSPASSVTSNGTDDLFDEKSLGSDSFDSPKMVMTAAASKLAESSKSVHHPIADIPSFSILENYMNSGDKESAVGKLAAAGVMLPHALAGPRDQQQAAAPSAEMMAAVAVASMVECTICARRFKNIPALNGHMRLHGGYYRKDMDKKSEPSSSSRPPTVVASNSSSGGEKSGGAAAPTQTVSNSVRSLIEEKIIQKRKLEPVQSKGTLSPSNFLHRR
jgi:hypothetical protein